MTILIDTSYLYALYNPDDSYSPAAQRFAKRNTEKVLVPTIVLPEVSFLFDRDFGYRGVHRFLQEFSSSRIPMVNIEDEDLKRAAQISDQYRGSKFDLVDCFIMALAERLNITRICTFDRRDFSIFKPKHTDHLDLLPVHIV